MCYYVKVLLRSNHLSYQYIDNINGFGKEGGAVIGQISMIFGLTPLFPTYPPLDAPQKVGTFPCSRYKSRPLGYKVKGEK